MKDFSGKSKPTLESLFNDQQVITGKKLVEREASFSLFRSLLSSCPGALLKKNLPTYYIVGILSPNCPVSFRTSITGFSRFSLEKPM